MDATRDIHIHLTAQPGTTVHVTIAADGIDVVSDEATADSAPSDDVLEAAIRRLESSGASPHIREAVDGLRALGYQLKPAKTKVPGKIPENYLRIIDPRHTAHGVGYLTPTYFSFSRGSDRERLEGMSDAVPLTSAIKFPHIDSARPGLEAARLLKG